jgi:integrase
MPSASGPRLRLYDHSRDAREAWTLSEFFESEMQPQLAQLCRKADTVQEYRSSLRLWEQATGRATLAAIGHPIWGAQAALHFTRALAQRTFEGEPIRANTQRKHITHVQAVLDRLLPKSRDRPYAKGVLDDVPLVERPEKEHHEVDDSLASRDDLRRLREAIPGVFRGRGKTALIQAWQSLYELAFWTGCRVKALLAAEAAWLLDDGVSREYQGRWLAVPAGFSKSGRAYKAFLPSSAMPLIERLDGKLGSWLRLLPRSKQYFNQERRRLEEVAAIRPQASGLHAVRKLVGTELAMTSFAASQLQLGHAQGRSVTLDHYVGRRVQAEHCSKRAPL